MLIIIIIWTLALLPAAALADAPHRYVVQVDETLETLDIEARFDHPVRRVSARDRRASRYLLSAKACGNDRELRISRGRIVLPDDGVKCLRYRFDLARAARDDGRNNALAASNVVVSPAVWLWQPRRDRDIDLHFSADDAVQISVPWQQTGERRYTIGDSPGSGRAITAFGRFHYSEPTIADARLRIAVMSPDRGFDPGPLERWLVEAARNITLSYERFPNPSPQIVVIPTGGRGNSAVLFGRVLRDGGESIELFVNETRPIDEFHADWTATHEFSHLMLPYVTIRQRWVSEGFAQYYQNVLLARAGIYDVDEAWQKLYEGLERGRRSRPGMSPDDASRTRASGSLMKIYWSGAAMALMADVELRRRSGGEESLDTVLDRLQRCCLPSTRVWTARELFATLDEQVEQPVFIPLYERYAYAPGFPDYGATFAALGLDVRQNIVYLNDDAELSAVRDAITRVPKSLASGHSEADSVVAMR